MFRQLIIVFRSYGSNPRWILCDELVTLGYPMSSREYADVTESDLVKCTYVLADSFVWRPCV